MEVKDRVERLNERLGRYIPPRETWTPAEEALFKPTDLYRVPIDEAQAMQLKAIKHAFTRHYTLNGFYRTYCEESGVTPSDIKTADDLEKIPLIPDVTFKTHPSGKDFAYWITVIFTGDLPQIVIKGANPTFDDTINAFNAAGLAVMFSSGTSGRPTVVPRDMRNSLAAKYALAKVLNSTLDLFSDDTLVCFPKPTTNLFLAKMASVIPEPSRNGHYALDIDMPAELTQRAMSGKTKPKGAADSYPQSEMLQRIVNTTVQWLERHDKTEENILLCGPPFLFLHIMSTLHQQGKRFEFGERAQVGTGGGWKTGENKRISLKAFRKQAQDVLGIPETHCIDAYGMCEGDGFMVQCPEGHYLHATYTYFKPLVLDDALMPMGYGEWGRFAFLDGLAQTYPGFIISGDRARLFERCPVCDRPGPVLEPEVQRAKGAEVRGCAEEVRRILEQELKGGNQ